MVSCEHLWESKMYGYRLHIYLVEIKDPVDFDEPHYETEYTEWMTLDEFNDRGRPDHKFIVEYFHKKIPQKLS
jgi:hypothetical protein